MHHVDVAHVPLGMIGSFKRTVGLQMYIQPLAIRSKSGLEYRLWLHRMLTEYNSIGIVAGPVFRRAKTRAADQVERASVGDINLLLHPALLRVQSN